MVINENGSKETVDLGCTVTIRDVEYGDEETYTIVGSTEVDPGNGRISLKSPIGRALMGHPQGRPGRGADPGRDGRVRDRHDRVSIRIAAMK